LILDGGWWRVERGADRKGNQKVKGKTTTQKSKSLVLEEKPQNPPSVDKSGTSSCGGRVDGKQ
jgi:hypothetical protein